jgi:hypothetical protein
MAAALRTQQLQLLPLVRVPAPPHQLEVRIVCIPGSAALAPDDRELLCREMPARHEVRHIRGGKNQCLVIKQQHRPRTVGGELTTLRRLSEERAASGECALP